MRKIAIALALIVGLVNWAAAQAPPAVPALPDSQRLTTYSISATTCACSVGFALYGSGTDVDEWIQVYISGTAYLSTDPTHGWSLSSATGSLGSIPRPITNAVLTFNAVQTGTVQIVGAERPRRLTQFSENRGVAARDLNQAVTDQTAISREFWDKLNRAIVGQPGDVFPPLPLLATRAGKYLCFDSGGLPITCQSATSGSITLPGSSVNGDSVCFAGTTGTSFSDCGWKITGTPTIGQVPEGNAAGTAVWTIEPVNPVALGADPTGASDSSAAFLAAIAASNHIRFPPGLFRFNQQITINLSPGQSMTIDGSGQEVTQLFWPGATNGIVVNYSGPLSSFHFRDLEMATGGVGTNVGLTLAQTFANSGTAGHNSDIMRVTFRGLDGYQVTDYWSIAIQDSNVNNVFTQGLAIFGANPGAGTGIRWDGLPSSMTYATGLWVTHGTFSGLLDAVVLGSYWQGFIMDTSQILGSGTGVGAGIFVPSAQTGNNGYLSVSNTSFGVLQFNISVQTPIDATLVNNNYFVMGDSSQGVYLPDHCFYSVANNIFIYPGVVTATGVTIGVSNLGICNAVSDSGSVTGNTFFRVNIPVALLNGSTGVVVSNNTFNQAVTPISSASVATNNIIVNNVGYNPVGVTNTTTVGASPATICAGPTPETHYYSQSATNTATVKLVNTGGPVVGTMASGVTVVADLGSNECVFVTWVTTAPTYAKSVH
jgi:hypothetical protein